MWLTANVNCCLIWKLISYQTSCFSLKYGPMSLRIKPSSVFTAANQSGSSEMITVSQIAPHSSSPQCDGVMSEENGRSVNIVDGAFVDYSGNKCKTSRPQGGKCLNVMSRVLSNCLHHLNTTRWTTNAQKPDKHRRTRETPTAHPLTVWASSWLHSDNSLQNSQE